MSLPGKQNRSEDDRPAVPTEAAKFSRLSAKMVELSLQRRQNDPILHSAVQDKLNPVSSPLPLPLPWPTTSTFATPPRPPQLHGTPRESKISKCWKEVCCSLDYWSVRARVIGSGAVRQFYEHTKSAQKTFSTWNLKSRVGAASRLRASTGVSVFLAVLVVGVIFGARHYAYRSYTARHGNRNSSLATPAVQDIAQRRSSSTVDANGIAAVTPQPRPITAERSRIRKIRVSKHDDYVAPDTYVYYGNKGEPTK
jgi:hypothetical protein